MVVHFGSYFYRKTKVKNCNPGKHVSRLRSKTFNDTNKEALGEDKTDCRNTL